MHTSPTKPVLTLPQYGLYWYSLVTTFTAWVLVWLGGLVTSKEAGMTVPDWPTSFGYNMFLLPISHWTGGILYEHTHRLLASVVGLLVFGLMILLYNIDSRHWVRRLGVILLFMVVAQGVLGGLRVILAQTNLGFLHGCFAQACLATAATISLVTSPWWTHISRVGHHLTAIRVGWIKHVRMVTILIFLQLTLGAAMRHAHAGLSIPDFPTAYGSWWPHVTRDSIEGINQDRVARMEPPTSLVQIHLQMTHRLLAVVILLAILSSTALLWSRKGVPGPLKTWNALWTILVLLQVYLGAWTIWSHKAADVATAHVAVGALLLSIGVLQILMARRINDVISTQGRPVIPV